MCRLPVLDWLGGALLLLLAVVVLVAKEVEADVGVARASIGVCAGLGAVRGGDGGGAVDRPRQLLRRLERRGGLRISACTRCIDGVPWTSACQMLPSLDKLDPGALNAGPPVKRPRPKDDEAAPEPAAANLHLLGLPPDVLAMIFRQLDADPGVPMLLVRRVQHVFQADISEFVPGREDVFYMRLPDPKAGALNADRFYEDGYESPAILEGVVDMAGFDANTTMTQFLRVSDKDFIPDKLVDKDVYVEGDYYTILSLS